MPSEIYWRLLKVPVGAEHDTWIKLEFEPTFNRKLAEP
jgi:hypothetical protein